MLSDWTISLFMGLVAVLFIIIFFFIRINNRNNEYYKLIHSDLLSLVPFKIDLEKNIVFFCDKLEVLNYKNKVSLFVFKSMINRKSKVELEILFQNLLFNQIPFRTSTFFVTFKLQEKNIIYDLSFDYYDKENKILFGKMQSNTRYNRFLISDNIVMSQSQFTVPKTEFVKLILEFFNKQRYNAKTNTDIEYMILVKIKNYNSLESVLTNNNIESMEILIAYYLKQFLGKDNTIICKYYDGQFLVYTKQKRINLPRLQKRLNNRIKSNLVEKSSYLQILTQFYVVSSHATTKHSSVNLLYNKIIDENHCQSTYHDFIEIKLKTSDLKKTAMSNHYELLFSEEVKKLLTINLTPVYKYNEPKVPAYYYAYTSLIANQHYDDYFQLIRNIQDAGLYWKVYEPLLLKAFEKYTNLKDSHDLVIPLLLIELENNTVLTQIINMVNKKRHLFKNCHLIFEFRDNSISVINNWTKYDNIITLLRESNIKIAFSHEMRNINNYRLISHCKPDLVVLTPQLLENITVSFDKFITVIICLNYLKILGIKNILGFGVKSAPEVILLKSIGINYLAGEFFENEQTKKLVDVLKYKNYWKWKRSQNAKGV